MNVSNILVFECVLVHITDYGIHSYIMFTIVLVSSGLVNSIAWFNPLLDF